MGSLRAFLKTAMGWMSILKQPIVGLLFIVVVPLPLISINLNCQVTSVLWRLYDS